MTMTSASGINNNLLFVLFAFIHNGIHAFQPSHHNSAAMSTRTYGMRHTACHMVRYDKVTQKWFATTEMEEPAAGYGILGSLYRAGPVPAFQRIVNADNYEQGVLKYMAKEGCDRVVSRGCV